MTSFANANMFSWLSRISRQQKEGWNCYRYHERVVKVLNFNTEHGIFLLISLRKLLYKADNCIRRGQNKERKRFWRRRRRGRSRLTRWSRASLCWSWLRIWIVDNSFDSNVRITPFNSAISSRNYLEIKIFNLINFHNLFSLTSPIGFMLPVSFFLPLPVSTTTIPSPYSEYSFRLSKTTLWFSFPKLNSIGTKFSMGCNSRTFFEFVMEIWAQKHLKFERCFKKLWKLKINFLCITKWKCYRIYISWLQFFTVNNFILCNVKKM